MTPITKNTVLTPFLAALLIAGPVTGAALAAEPRPGEPRPAEEDTGSSDVREPSSQLTADSPTSDGWLLTDADRHPVGPGLEHQSFDRYDARGWLRGDVLVADLSESRLTLDYTWSGEVSTTAPLSADLARDRAVAGVNGDFFDIGDTGAALGVGVDRQDGILHGPARGRTTAFWLDRAGVPDVGSLPLRAELLLADGSTVPVTNLNSPTVLGDGIGAYTPAWGTDARSRVVDDARNVREVTVVDGVVTTNVTTLDDGGPISDDTVLLVGRGRGADVLAALVPGTRVDLDYGFDGTDPVVAVGGSDVLLQDGAVVTGDDGAMHPRTAIGIDDDRDALVMVTVDGRQSTSRGVTLVELARLLKEYGAEDALNLDGGGSSTMVAREPGEEPLVVNSPSDGAERHVPNGLGFTVSAGSGDLTGLDLEPTVDERGSLRVFTGLTRRLSADGHDETYAPVPADPTWSTGDDAVLRVVSDDATTATVRGHAPGRTTAVATQNGVRGSVEVDVLGRVARIGTDDGQLALPDRDARGTFTVTGHDAGGFSTWIEPADVRLDYDRSTLRITPSEGGFAVEPLVDQGTATITVTVAGRTTYVGVTIGLEQQVLATMDSAAGWTARTFPSVVTASLRETTGRSGSGGALAMDYSLTGTTATRAAYFTAQPEVPLPGDPQRIGLWVNGDGNGGWLRLNVRDAAGVLTTLNLAPEVDWTGWRYVSTDLPSGLPRPLTFVRTYVVETDGTQQYGGSLGFDDLTVEVALLAEVPAVAPVEDPAVLQTDTVGDDRWRFAVMSDAQFVAAAPNSDLVAQARRTMREIVAADPDFVVINGDLVDTAFDADIDLARRLIDEELEGKVPWYYVPGNHEIYGPGDLTNWRAEFGEPVRGFDHRGTRFLLLDSSLGGLRLGGFEQVQRLQRTLSKAAVDRSVRSVVVMAHHPTEDPAVVDNSELADPLESALVERWLSEFRAETGKGAAYVAAHAGLFHAARVDGVHLLVNGNSGKAPAAAPGEGGFTGWTLIGVDPDVRLAETGSRGGSATRGSGRGWLVAEMRPHVDELRLDAPAELAVGAEATVGATVVQAGREVPVAYPVSAAWDGSQGLFVGPPTRAGAEHVAAYDPETDVLTALRPGTVEVRVRVNEVTRTATVTVPEAG